MMDHAYLNAVSTVTEKMMFMVSASGEVLVSDVLSKTIGCEKTNPSIDQFLKRFFPEWDDSMVEAGEWMAKITGKVTSVSTLSGTKEMIFKRVCLNESDCMVALSCPCEPEVGCAIEAFKEYRSHAEHLLQIKDRLMSLSAAMMSIKDQTELLELILDTALMSVKETSVGSILVLDEKSKLKILASRGYRIEHAENFVLPLEESFYFVATSGVLGEVIVINDLQTFSPETPVIPMADGNNIRSVMSAPLIVDGQLYGFMNLDSPEIAEFVAADKELYIYLKHQVEEVLFRYKLYNEILTLSRYDRLTGALTRSYFEEVYGDYVKLHVEKENGFTVVIFDLDGLKTVNDNFGHQAGDKLIKTFTAKMMEAFIGEDLFARLGGDEFILVSDRLTRSDMLGRLSMVVAYFEANMIEYNSLYYGCNFSYGISSYPNDSSDKSVLMKLADERMYEHKKKQK